MFFPDKVQGYKEARRVLKAGGHFIFNVWDKISNNEFAETIAKRWRRDFRTIRRVSSPAPRMVTMMLKESAENWPQQGLLLCRSTLSTT